MLESFRAFLKDEGGAVTVDWVVLTAGVVLMAAGVAAYFGDTAIRPLMDNVATSFKDATTGTATVAAPASF